MHRFVVLAAAAVTFAACGRDHPLRSIDSSGVAVDAGQLPKPDNCTVAFTGPDCCDAAQQRLGSAACVDGDYVCTSGEICGCHGQAQTFHCSDFCGSDAFVSATCGGAGWICPPGLIETSSCPPDTCWGEPGDLCLAARCVEGRWVCENDDGGTQDPI